MLAGTAVSTVSTIKQGEAAAHASEQEAALRDQAARDITSQSEEEARRQAILNKKQLGSMKAGYGASGVSLDGSALDILEESAAQGELDLIAIRTDGERRARMARGEADISRGRAGSQRQGAYMSGAGNFLSGAAGAYNNYADNKPPKEPPAPKRTG